MATSAANLVAQSYLVRLRLSAKVEHKGKGELEAKSPSFRLIQSPGFPFLSGHTASSVTLSTKEIFKGKCIRKKTFMGFNKKHLILSHQTPLHTVSAVVSIAAISSQQREK